MNSSKMESSAISDDEKSDEWIESYDSYNSDDEFEDQVLGDDKPVFDSIPVPKSSSENEESVSESDENNDTDTVVLQNDGEKLKSNPGWADAMAKILKTKKTKKTIVLSKAKKIKDIKPKKEKLDFEIVGENEQDEDVDEDRLDDKKLTVNRRLMMKEYQAKGRVKPSILDKDRERTLMKIATKGVVQLFNAVRHQQRNIDKSVKKAGKSEIRREKILESIDKKQILNKLTGSAKSIRVDDDLKFEEVPEKQKCTWGVLRDDFMMGAQLKDWDKKEDSS